MVLDVLRARTGNLAEVSCQSCGHMVENHAPNFEVLHYLRRPGEDNPPILIIIGKVLLQESRRLIYLSYTMVEDQLLAFESPLTRRELPYLRDGSSPVSRFNLSARAINGEFQIMLSLQMTLSQPAYGE